MSTPPPTTGINHFSPTVSDVEASAEWYVRVFGLQRLPMTFPHHGDEQGGYAVLLADPRTGLMIGLHHHEACSGERFDERRPGLDHLAWGVSAREDLDAWAAWLDENGVEHSGVTDKTEPMPYSTVVFRDPDGIQLELMHAPG
ncbi:VOC family protein [Pseudonocardia ailaonensis]|uniref:VOC family protein n=1 Tax=Pseudonocardia ailaonensis TaxID=367279 RepID=A0ABN2N2G0_9PSEU